MTPDEQEARDHIASLEEELRTIPAAPHNAQKIADRERQLAFYRRYVTRLESIRESYLVRKAELLFREFPSIF